MHNSIRRTVFMTAIAAAMLPAGVHAQATATPSGAPRSASPIRDQAKAAAIREILTLTHASDQAILAMETSLPAQRAANPAIPAVFWDRFLTQAKARKGELEDQIMIVYDRHFSTDELRGLIAFYKTPVGQKMLQVQPIVVQESILAGQQWGQKIGMEVGQQLANEGVKVP